MVRACTARFVSALRSAGCDLVFVYDGPSILEQAASIDRVLCMNLSLAAARRGVTSVEIKLKARTQSSRRVQAQSSLERLTNAVDVVSRQSAGKHSSAAPKRAFGPQLLETVLSSSRREGGKTS